MLMTVRPAIVCWVVILLAGDWAPHRLAAQQADDPPGPSVSELVDGLDANRLAQRQQAERDLIALGPGILDSLPEPDGRFSAEAQQRLRRIRRELEQMRAEQAADAKLIQLDAVQSLDEALTRIHDLSGIEFATQPNFDAQIDLNLGSPQTFWTTLDTVLDAANADVNFYMGEPGQLGISARGEERPSRTDSAAYAGIYRLEPLSVFSRRNLHNPALSGLSVTTEIAWEPRLTPIGLSLPLDSVLAVLDDGQQLRPKWGRSPSVRTHPFHPQNSASPFRCRVMHRGKSNRSPDGFNPSSREPASTFSSSSIRNTNRKLWAM